MSSKKGNKTQKEWSSRHHVFISYRHSDDREFRQRFQVTLEQWLTAYALVNLKIQPGQDWRKTIDDALRKLRTAITTNWDTVLEDALSEATPGLNLADEIRKATNLQVSEHTRLVVSESVESVDSLTVDLVHHLRNHHDDVQKLKWDLFEHLVAEFLASRGFQDVSLVGRDPLTSADIYAAYVVDAVGEKLRFFVEVKRTRDKVGVDVINQVLGAFVLERPRLGWDVAMIVSLAGFRELQKTSDADVSFMGVKLKDKDDVARWLQGYEPGPHGLWLPKPSRHLPISTQPSKGQQSLGDDA